MNHDPRRMGEALGRVVGGLGSRSVMLELHTLWSEVVGDAIAERCRPRRLLDGVLVVGVDHPGWATEVRFLEPEIVGRLAEVLPDLKISTVQVVVDQGGS